MDHLSDPSAERAVLAGILRHGADAYFECFDIVGVDSFTILSNQCIYKCILEVFTKEETVKVDVPTILSAAKSVGVYEFINQEEERRHLGQLLNFFVELENVRKFARKVKKLQVLREVYDKLGGCRQSLLDFTGDESIDEIITKIEQPVFDISNSIVDNTTGKIVKLGDNLDEYIENILNNKGRPVGVSTGYPIFDKYLGGGLRRGTVNVLGARTGVGKSLISDNISLHVAGKLNIPVLYVDTEMSEFDHHPRCLGILSQLPISSIEDGSFDTSHNCRLDFDEAVVKLKNMPISYVSTNGKTFEEALSLIRRWIIKDVGLDKDGLSKDCIVIYDYFGLAGTDELSRNVQEFQLLGVKMDKLRTLAFQYQFPTLALVQLNRDGITRDDTGVVSGSDRILHPAATFAIYREKSEEEIGEDGPRYGNRKLVIRKSRHGPVSAPFDYICMNMDTECCSIKEIDLKSNLPKDKDLEVDDDGEEFSAY